MDVVNTDYIIMEELKKQNSIKSKNHNKIWVTELEVQHKQFTRQEIQICLNFTLTALGVRTATFSIFLLDSSASRLPGQQGCGAKKSLSAG